tara:strand:- start:857 stop:1039 length:183 start_codon:yes stop_codon:yes gene_type:complete
MSEFLEYDETKKSIKTLNLDDFSVEDLNKYILELKDEIERTKKEIEKKSELINQAKKYFS